MKQPHNLKVNIPQKSAYSYDILIGENLINIAGELVKKYSNSQKFLIVTNETVAELYKNSLNIENSSWLILKDGEEYKNFETLKHIIDECVKNRLERNDCIIAFGGGVIGDMAGFAAASYMRGIDFIQIPTTLLAQVDSSVGGKVAINHEHGKNLIGAFYQPKAVLIDTNVLKTLDLRQLKTGLAEVLKYAFIEKTCGFEKEFNLYDFLELNRQKIFELDSDVISKLIYMCCALKACVVNKDETEKGLRAILNLGHTFAHAIENLTNYTLYTHGEAVAAGLKMAFKLSRLKNLIDKNYYDKAVGLIDNYDLVPKMTCFDKEKFYSEMFLDKKAQGGKVRFVLPKGACEVEITSEVAKEQVFEVL